MSEDGGDIGAFMAGFVIGGLVGAATALIMAPQSGAETRAQIADKAEISIAQAQTKVYDTSTQVQERARIVLDEGKYKLRKDHAGEPVQASDNDNADGQEESTDKPMS